MRLRGIVLNALFLAFALSASVASAQSPRMILALGNTGFLNPADIRASTGAEVKQDTEKYELKDFPVIVLANIAYPALPGPIQQGLVEYVGHGGTVLISGGAQSFGSGGYQAVASMIPFQMRSTNDWRSMPFREPVLIQPSHPILAGVTFIPVGTLNDMNPRADAMEILQKAGGGVAGFANPLVAELGVGAGRVIGMAFDLNELAGMRDRDVLVRNTIAYLLSVSRIQGR